MRPIVVDESALKEAGHVLERLLNLSEGISQATSRQVLGTLRVFVVRSVSVA